MVQRRGHRFQSLGAAKITAVVGAGVILIVCTGIPWIVVAV
jgi:hypothetical protein